MKLPRVLLIGNVAAKSGFTPGMFAQLQPRLAETGWSVIAASRRNNRWIRFADMLFAVVGNMRHYDVANVEVYSGNAFVWAEAICGVLSLLGKPYLLSLHGGNLPEFSHARPRRVKRLLRSARAVTAPSRYLVEALREYRADISMLPNAIDVSAYSHRRRKHARPRMIWVRAFARLYNPQLALRVLAAVREHWPEAHLSMIGPDKNDGTLAATRTLADQLKVGDNLSLVGPVTKSELPRHLADHDVFLNTTNIDNMPVSVLEAMASGLCVVSTNVGGMPDLLEHERTGLLVPADDAVAMAGQVARILEQPVLSETLSANAGVESARYDWARYQLSWEQLVMDVVR